jgi:polyphosphate glucokinase
MSSSILLGLDVGGSSIKAGLVDVERQTLIGELISRATPQPATPQAVMRVAAELAAGLPSGGPVGLAFPSVVQAGRVRTAAHVDKSWLDVDGGALGRQALGRPVKFLNDADAAGIAEMCCGAGRGTRGTVIMLTFGTGIGTALFTDGRLLPNTELGHLQLHGVDAEEWASARIRTKLGLDWPEWIERVNQYLAAMHALLWPDVFILGGAVSERFAEFAPLLRSPAQIRPAQHTGQAGVIGAALAAAELRRQG